MTADLDANGEQLIRDLHVRNGARLKIFVNDSWLPLAPIISKTGPAATGVYLPYYSLADSLLPATGKQFVRQLRTRERAPIQSFGAAPAAQAAEVLLDAIARSNGTRASVNDARRSTRVHNGILGNFSFDANGDIVPARLTIFRIAGGKRRNSTNVSDFDGRRRADGLGSCEPASALSKPQRRSSARLSRDVREVGGTGQCADHSMLVAEPLSLA